MNKKLYSRSETCKFFGVTNGTLRNWEKNGHIEPPIRIGRRVYWTEEHFNRLLGRYSGHDKVQENIV